MDTKIYKCQSCGAPFRGEPGTRGFRCEYCGTVNEIIENQNAENRSARVTKDESQTQTQTQTESKPPQKSQAQESNSTETKNEVDELIDRANALREIHNIYEARLTFDQALNLSPKEYRAYLGKLLLQLRLNEEEDLANGRKDLTRYENYNKLLSFAPEDKKAVYEGYNNAILKRLEEAEVNQPIDIKREIWLSLVCAFIIISVILLALAANSISTYTSSSRSTATSTYMPASTSALSSPAIAIAPTATQKSTPVPTTVPPPVPTPIIKTYGSGQYKVGKDLPAGEYVLITTDIAYFEISSDSTGSTSSIITNDFFENRSIVSVSEGEYLKISNSVMYSFKDAPPFEENNGILPQGMYRVGFDLLPGEYKVIPDSDYGYLEVTYDSRHTLDSIIYNDNLEGEQYITVNYGQYLTLSDCHLKLQ